MNFGRPKGLNALFSAAYPLGLDRVVVIVLDVEALILNALIPLIRLDPITIQPKITYVEELFRRP